MEFHHSAALSILVILSAATYTAVVQANTELDLITMLLTNYSRLARPTATTASTLAVGLEMALTHVYSQEENEETMRLGVQFKMTWRDHNLQWPQDDHDDLRDIALPSTEIWIPPLSISNAVGFNFDAMPSSWVQVQWSGAVTWYVQGVLDVYCPVDSMYFPLDYRRCDIIVTSPSMSIERLRLETADDSDAHVTADVTLDSPTWCFRASSLQAELVTAAPTVMRAQLLFKRKWLHNIINLLMPAVAVSVWLLAQFGLPPESGERVTSCCLSLVALFLLMVLTSNAIPGAAFATPLPAVYYLCLICLDVVIVAVHGWVISVHGSSPSRRPPSWVRKMVSACLPCAERKPHVPIQEPSYLSHMQMLRERMHSIPQPEWNMPDIQRQAPSAPSPDMQTMRRDDRDMSREMTMRVSDLRFPPAMQPPLPPVMSPPWPPEDRLPPQGQQNMATRGSTRSYPDTRTTNLEMLLSRQLHLMRTVTDRLHEMSQTDIIRGEWKNAARLLNCIAFSVVLLLVIGIPLVVFLYIPSSGIDEASDVEGMVIVNEEC